MNTDINTLFENLWQAYIKVTPTATKIHKLLGSTQQDDIINDHIALRTFSHPKVNIDVLAKHFEVLGYYEAGQYHFKEKKLYAKHFEHQDKTKPKVFISELDMSQFPLGIQNEINHLVSQVLNDDVKADDFLYSGRHWKLDYRTYKILLEHSEYAAWLAVWGYIPNHFTVSINHLNNFDTIQEVNDKLKESGFVLNDVGGEIKGSKEVLLEQSATIADKIMVNFTDWEKEVPSCFYEFALRYPKEDGELYTGFVEANANNIFDSTNSR